MTSAPWLSSDAAQRGQPPSGDICLADFSFSGSEIGVSCNLPTLMKSEGSGTSGCRAGRTPGQPLLRLQHSVRVSGSTGVPRFPVTRVFALGRVPHTPSKDPLQCREFIMSLSNQMRESKNPRLSGIKVGLFRV